MAANCSTKASPGLALEFVGHGSIFPTGAGMTIHFTTFCSPLQRPPSAELSRLRSGRAISSLWTNYKAIE
jgi:hypothetical protein